MRITFVIDYLYGPTGGTEQQMITLAHGMRARGHNVEIAVLRGTEYTEHHYSLPFKITDLGISSILSLATLQKFWQFRRTAVANKVDVVHGFFNDVAILLPLFFVGTKLKSFTSRRDMGIWYTRPKLLLLRVLSRLQTRIICNCDAVAQHAIRNEHIDEAKVFVIRNGVAGQDGNYADHPPDWLQLPESGEAFNIVAVSNVRPIKRIEDIVRAAEFVCTLDDRINFYVIGDLPDKRYHQTLESMIKDVDLVGRIHFTGKIDEPKRYLRYFSLGISSSESEGLSNSIIEFMAAGVPIIASSVGGTPELITDGKNGFLYPVGDVKALASLINRLFTDTVLSEQIAAAAQTSILDLGVDRMVDEHEDTYCR